MKAEGEPLHAVGSTMVSGMLQPSQPSPVLVCTPGTVCCNQKVKAEFWYQACALSVTLFLQQTHPGHVGLP